MSSANKFRQSSKSASSPEPKTDVQPHSVSQPPSSEENAMDQPLESTLTVVPPAPPNPSEIMSSTDSPSPDPIPTPESPATPAELPTDEVAATSTENESTTELNESQSAALRQQPIPPASEPMQYRAIGLVRGQYVASDEQFTRGSIFTDDGFEIGAVLLGRVMSLVKKHVDLEQPHLWVVYPRTREKGDGDLHVQIVGVWEPENLNRMMESSEQESGDQELDELELVDAELDESELDESELDESESDESDLDESEDATEAVEAEVNEAKAVEAEAVEAEPASEEPTEVAPVEEAVETETATSSADQPQAETTATEENALPPVPASELDDKYFSVRGEVIYQSVEEQQILVKIRRIPRPGTDHSKAFKVVLKGVLEGKAVGYFWDLDVQREGNALVVRNGTMIAAVPPQKRKKPAFNKRGGGGGYRGGRPPQGGGPRKPWQNREGSSRPSRPGERSDRPMPSQNRENRAPAPRPRPVIKRRNPEKPEG